MHLKGEAKLRSLYYKLPAIARSSRSVDHGFRRYNCGMHILHLKGEAMQAALIVLRNRHVSMPRERMCSSGGSRGGGGGGGG